MRNTTFLKTKEAISTIIFFGIVSLFGDIIYEGIRSINGPFLYSLGASALIVGFFSGFGEFLTYILRFLSGYFIDKKRNYWLFTITGYFLICSLPLLAYVKIWQIAIFLFLVERIGKGIRTPARDTLISFAGKNIGYGKSFGIHELLDQIGAVLGPLIFYFILSKYKNYSIAFKLMWIPFIFLIASLILAKKNYKIIIEKNNYEMQRTKVKLNKSFVLYILFILFSVAGVINFPIISYHFAIKGNMGLSEIPILYMIAMGIDGIVSFFIGDLYDRVRFKTLYFIPFLTVLLSVFVLSLNFYFLLMGIIIYGIIIGCHETILRATIAEIIPFEKRGFAYGVFNSIYGFGFFIGGWLIGFLYEKNLSYILFYVICIEIISFLFLLTLIKNVEKIRKI
ncbi:MAG: MFS transporter [Candidatus Omnitrophica bacterium]|nr:MFS transporter [Candidatus Omnitrophota bacterium]